MSLFLHASVRSPDLKGRAKETGQWHVALIVPSADYVPYAEELARAIVSGFTDVPDALKVHTHEIPHDADRASPFVILDPDCPFKE